jgi:hypothetical protein
MTMDVQRLKVIARYARIAIEENDFSSWLGTVLIY